MAADRHCLFGLLALQTGLIQQAQLVAAFHAWTCDKSRSLADHLIVLGHLNAAQRAAVEALAALQIEAHGGDVERSLAAVPAGKSTRESLAKLGDPDIEATLGRVGSGRGATAHDGQVDPEGTIDYSAGSATSNGQRFRVLRPHAQGGLGAVFVALDQELHREIALKQILAQHADNPTIRARFLLEAEVTGGLEHPGVVPVYGLGTYADGRPYYAMRFIRGDSLKETIDHFHADQAQKPDPGRRSLELRKLLRRFLDVCNAIDYAHSRGVLHRDIKPGNIIVGKHGETLVVDWGLAKAMGKVEAGIASDERMLMPSSASGSAETLPGSAMGTPSYMSPEQACGDLDRLGPGSDVYSLGATLHCLLTGNPPFAGDDLGAVLRAVQKGDFPPPRAVDPSIDRALEAICLKAMALHPADRYGSARALADEVERWMADEPVSAWREPFSRRARRWARQNRTAAAAAAVALLAVVVGLFALAAVQSKANRDLQKANDATNNAKNMAEAALAETRDAKNATEVALGRSEESRKQAEAVSAFLIEAFRSPDPSQDGRQIKVVDLLDRAVATLDKEFTGTAATKGALLNALGETDYGLGSYDKAAATFAKARAVQEIALGPDHPETLASRNNLGLATLSAGRTSEAVTILEETLKLSEPKLGPDHPDTLSRRNNLAMAYLAAGRATEAMRMDEGTLALRERRLGPDHPETLGSRNNLADDYIAAGRTEDGARLHEGTLKLLESKLGPDYPLTIRSRNNLAEALRAAGRPARTIELHEANLNLMVPKLGPDHPDTLQVRNNLAYTHESLGRWRVAEALRRETLARRRKTTKPGSVLVAGDLAWLGRNLLNQAKWSEAEAFLRESLEIQVKASPDGWPRFNTMSLLGEVLAGRAQYAEAEPLGLGGYEGLKAREAKIPAQTRIQRLSEAAERVVRLYEAWGKPERAAAWKARHGLAELPTDVFARP